MALDNRSSSQRFTRLFRDDPEHPNPLLKPPALFTFLLAIGAFALIFGSLDLSNALRSPFQPKGTESVNASGAQEILALKQKDTDGDSISDYDELYVQHTSPYLKDSDSDGFTDAQEIQSGNDPNCPSGNTCGAPVANTNQITGVGAANAATNSSIDAATLRETLKNAGAPASVIDSTDDSTLLQLYNQVVNESTTGNSNDSNAGNSSDLSGGAITLDVLQNLSPQEMRDLLTSSGVDAATINSLSDSELSAIFKEAVQEQVSGQTNGNANASANSNQP